MAGESIEGIAIRWTVLAAELEMVLLSCFNTGPKGDWVGLRPSCKKSNFDEAG